MCRTAQPRPRAEGKLGKHPADPHDDVVPGRFFKRLLNGLRLDQAAASWLPTACAAMGFAQRGLSPVVRYRKRTRLHCFGRNTGMRQSCPSGRSSQTSGP